MCGSNSKSRFRKPDLIWPEKQPSGYKDTGPGLDSKLASISGCHNLFVTTGREVRFGTTVAADERKLRAHFIFLSPRRQLPSFLSYTGVPAFVFALFFPLCLVFRCPVAGNFLAPSAPRPNKRPSSLVQTRANHIFIRTGRLHSFHT